jgi:DNA ligase-1
LKESHLSLFDDPKPPVKGPETLPIRRPLLAAKAKGLADFEKLQYPLMVSPKLDGIRCIVRDGVVVTRNFKTLPNRYTRGILETCSREFPEYTWDGELMLGAVTSSLNRGPEEFGKVQSAFMSFEGEPTFCYNIFDCVKDASILTAYQHRFHRVIEQLDSGHKFFRIVPHYQANTPGELLQWAHAFVEWGYEGIMVRHPNGRYKEGRSTLREQVLIKWKPLEDADGPIVSIEPLMSNQNTAEKNVFGLTERSSEKAGMVEQPMCGVLMVRHANGEVFGVGTGLDQATRYDFWNRRTELIGKTVSYQFEGLGSNGKPRFPRFRGLRPEMDEM